MVAEIVVTTFIRPETPKYKFPVPPPRITRWRFVTRKSRNESIPGDQLSEKPVIRKRTKFPLEQVGIVCFKCPLIFSGHLLRVF